MEWLLDKKHLNEFKLHQYLYNKNQTVILLQDVMDYFKWSKYLVTTTIDNLNHDYQSVMLPANVTLKIVNKEVLKINQIHLINEFEILSYLIRNSIQYRLLLDLFLEQTTSNEKIAEIHGVSATLVRNAKLTLTKKLADRQIKIVDNQLVGNEIVIRSLMFESLYTLSTYGRQDVLATSPYFNEQLERAMVGNQSLSMQTKIGLQVFLNVWSIRLLNGHQLQPNAYRCGLVVNAELSDSATRLYRGLMQIVSHNFTKFHNITLIEFNYGLDFMYALGVRNDGYRYGNLQPWIKTEYQIIQDIISSEYKHFFGIILSEPEKNLLADNLFALNFRLITLKENILAPMNENFEENVNFPIHTTFTRQVVKHLAAHWQVDETQLQDQIFNQYLNAFIIALDQRRFLPVLKIGIDFIDQQGLTTVLIDYLTSYYGVWRSLNVTIIESIDDTVDLYISDTKVNRDLPGFIWRRMPSNLERMSLQETLISLMVEKFKKNH